MFDNFFQGAVFLCFTKLVAAIHSLNILYLFLNSTCSHHCVYTMHWYFYDRYDRYFYLRRIVTSKEYMQPYIWVVPPLFQETTCRGLVFSKVLSFFEINNCNYLCFQRYRVNLPPVAAIHSTNGPFSIIKEQLQPQILSNFLYFFGTWEVVTRRYHSYEL